MVHSIISLVVLLTFSFAQARDILFEGYYKITSGDQHIGFAISRYEYDGKDKKFYSTQFTKISNPGADIIESLSAVSQADENMTPVSYKYISLVGKESKTIEAKFTPGKKPTDKMKMVGTVVQGAKKPLRITNELAPNVFLSTFLSYRMLRSAQGIQTKNSYAYEAIAEEDGAVEKGKADILKEEKYKGFTAFKVENTFKKTLFVGYMNDKGEALATIVKDARITSELVPKASEAVGTIGLPESVVKTHFGNIPTGDKNVVAQYFKNSDTLNAPKGGKQEGFPAGQGIHIKGQTPSKKEGP